MTIGKNFRLSEIYWVAQGGHKLLNKLPIAAFPLRIYRSRIVSANLLLMYMILHRTVSLGSAVNNQAASSFFKAHITTRIII